MKTNSLCWPLICLLFVTIPFVGFLGWHQADCSAITPETQKGIRSAHSGIEMNQEPVVTAGLTTRPTSAQPTQSEEATALSQTISALRQSNNAAECRALSAALAAIGTEEAVEAIWQAAMDKPAGLARTAVLDGLENLIQPQAVTFSVGVLKATSDPEIVEALSRLIGRAADKDSVDHLSNLYAETDTTEARQKQIERMIAGIHNPPAARALGNLVGQIDQPDLAKAAATSLSVAGTSDSNQQLEDALAGLESRGTEAAAMLEAVIQIASGSQVPEESPSYNQTAETSVLAPTSLN